MQKYNSTNLNSEHFVVCENVFNFFVSLGNRYGIFNLHKSFEPGSNI